MRWEGNDHGVPNRSLWNGNATPYLRWRPAEGSWQNAFIEVGVGIQGISHTAIAISPDASHRMSTAFQFGERFLVGLTFGDNPQYEIASFVQHVSNGKIKLPNDGLTYYGVSFRFPLGRD